MGLWLPRGAPDIHGYGSALIQTQPDIDEN
jgi:hypothetical protein